ncbi:MAG: 50S ribosomal protein L24 [Planctomycetota bacterium]|nr:50S ribosomal protein L24 [Planctomycetota bacterium]
MAKRIKQGDMVAVISGDDRGKRGRVLRVVPGKDRVIIEGVNLVYKHLRKSQQHPQGGRIRREAAVHMSNVMPIDPETNKPTRVAKKVVEGKRTRVGIRSGSEVGAAPKAAAKPAKGSKKEA